MKIWLRLPNGVGRANALRSSGGMVYCDTWLGIVAVPIGCALRSTEDNPHLPQATLDCFAAGWNGMSTRPDGTPWLAAS